MWGKCPDLRGVCISWVEMYIKMVLGEENGVLIREVSLFYWSPYTGFHCIACLPLHEYVHMHIIIQQ